ILERRRGAERRKNESLPVGDDAERREMHPALGAERRDDGLADHRHALAHLTWLRASHILLPPPLWGRDGEGSVCLTLSFPYPPPGARAPDASRPRIRSGAGSPPKGGRQPEWVDEEGIKPLPPASSRAGCVRLRAAWSDPPGRGRPRSPSRAARPGRSSWAYRFAHRQAISALANSVPR